jgi:hypothetical protein
MSRPTDNLKLAPEAWIPDWMIEELLRQEREREEQSRERPYLELPLPGSYERPAESAEEAPSNRGVVTIDL